MTNSERDATIVALWNAVGRLERKITAQGKTIEDLAALADARQAVVVKALGEIASAAGVNPDLADPPLPSPKRGRKKRGNQISI